jgi:hypothetical protein
MRMRAEQAIYTSARTSRTRGYHLIAQSSGIDDQQARSLIQWCPSHAGLVSSDTDANSLNFHPLHNGLVALSRTVYGGPEYSSRGGLQIVTRILLLHGDQLAGYDFDPIMLAHVALAFGHLRLEPNAPQDLPAVDLPDRPLRAPCTGCDAATSDLVYRVWQYVSSNKRVAVIGVSSALHTLSQLFARIPQRQRLDFAFTTGLKPSMHRPFHLHFLPAADLSLQQQLAGQGIAVVS